MHTAYIEVCAYLTASTRADHPMPALTQVAYFIESIKDEWMRAINSPRALGRRAPAEAFAHVLAELGRRQFNEPSRIAEECAVTLLKTIEEVCHARAEVAHLPDPAAPRVENDES